MLLAHVDKIRKIVSPAINQKQKSLLGQFMTPAPVAHFMASMFPTGQLGTCRLLDAGAGLGALTGAFIDRWEAGEFAFDRIESTAHELDDTLRAHLSETLTHRANQNQFTSQVLGGDFIIQTALAILEDRAPPQFTHAILNPPYKKISSSGIHRQALSQVGIETVNLYSAFVALGIELLAAGGFLVAIIPRSFCNGTYYRAFRELILEKTAIRAIHLFDSRSKAFSDDEVLQENVIIMLEKGAKQGAVTVTTSSDDSFSDLMRQDHQFDRIVFNSNRERFIHVPTTVDETELEISAGITSTLDDIAIRVSTGPVVDFRLKSHLRSQSEAESAPLLYPMHFVGRKVVWPVTDGKKPNAIMINDETRGWLMPTGFYCVVRRFSSKEEKRRIVANVIRPDDFPDNVEFLGLENHVNVFNQRRSGLPELMAYGLAAYMNTSAVDQAFRRFSGHTQVNAGDLKTLRYPNKEVLEKLGQWMLENQNCEQVDLDTKFRELAS